MSGEGSDDGRVPPAADDHDQSGLELARSVARSLRTGPAIGRARRRKPLGPQSASRRRGGSEVSGAHPDGRDPQALDAAISKLVAEQGWATDVAVNGVFGRWDQIVGHQVAQHCRPEKYAGTELVVRADSTAWATQMRLLASTVVARMNDELGDGIVTRIKVLGPEAPSWRKGLRTVRGGRGPRDTYG